eukprot:CAMPEP_0194765064 /NCGR_PEP_ID=MMETSP0323_2-20130528/24708_1 /TAXON_ID=2866 ORGANISM="Crypthecodinium cohnii, Strain Seligo" /NCGR_SAMPLE_ID=MMETSP0323_2 /ASSEMBLY_ACC=CAM_ASM_000346 /LENGTH=42 /DNA_ID= /DNA_START= /DNA_END= /DNA_ORIENTATION=
MWGQEEGCLRGRGTTTAIGAASKAHGTDQAGQGTRGDHATHD